MSNFRIYPALLLLLSLSLHSMGGIATSSHNDTLSIRSMPTILQASASDEGMLELEFRPTIGLEVGMLTFIGDVSTNNRGFHPTVSRLGYQLRVSNPLNDFLELQFHTMFGRVSANERSIENLSRNMNFESRIRAGGVGVTYNFDHILPPLKKRNVDPFLYVGIEGFEFLSKTDKYDEFGNEYHYWSDGSIRNMAEDDPNSENAILINRDYVYETDLREQNLDSLGKYPERSWAIPIGAGINFYVTDNFRFRISSTFHMSFTDLIDNTTDESFDGRAGTPGNDKFLFTSFSVSYDLQKISGDEEVAPEDPILEPWLDPLLASDTVDTDNDGVVDMIDMCQYTPKEGLPVDEKGCPLDGDKDGVPNYMDDEPNSERGAVVDDNGVTLSDEDIFLAFRMYKDSTGEFTQIEQTIKTTVIGDRQPELKRPSNEELLANKEYFVILDKEKVNVEAGELYKYLGYKDFKTITQGDTVYYVLSGFDELADAKAANEDLENKGVETEGIGETSITEDGEEVIKTTSGLEILNTQSSENIPEMENPDGVVFRVQLNAYSKPVDDKLFDGLPNVVQLKGDDGLTRYYSGSFDNINKASLHKVSMQTEEGFGDAFVVAFRNGKRISIREFTEVDEGHEENIEKYETDIKGEPDEINPDDITYSVQVGAYQNEVPTDMLDMFLTLGNVKPVKDEESGLTRYLIGNFSSMEEAEAKKYEMQMDGVLEDAFVVGIYNGRVLQIDEIYELYRD